ncbi:hypothetical protein GL50803_0035487 [Giardia duodenalis]|uniref:Uncharacterized protein n=1 Tax=Giardia intestinalis (strain ATCC 50803 / WB clone C6) TaxID=184922 RepID=A8BAI0_GIAIC|nr:hypothetical protein GL50803_0035487 [Giardia intestinalis]KAE8303497.1 hypothetical protein GL50803_0035487 [Giardia intestinalis]|eukprot:XP_001708404.1 Hypothetical protein GL50803_35487 [Giardia lamblia ATCC 50803]
MSVSFRIPIVFCKLLHIGQREPSTLHRASPTQTSPASPSLSLKNITRSYAELQESAPTLSLTTITIRVVQSSIDNPALRGHPAFYEYNQFTLVPIRLLAIDVARNYALVALSTGRDSTDWDACTRSFHEVNLQLIHLDCYGSLQDDKDARFSYNLYNNGIYSSYEQSARYLIDNFLVITTADTLLTLRNRSSSDRFVNEDKRVTYLEHTLHTHIRRLVINSVCLLFNLHLFSNDYVKSQLQVQSQHFSLDLSPSLADFERAKKDVERSTSLLINPKTIWLFLRDNRAVLRSLLSTPLSSQLTTEQKSLLLTGDLYSTEAHGLLLLLCPVLPAALEGIISDYSVFYSQAVSYTLMRLCTIDDVNEETRVLAPRKSCDLQKIALILKGLSDLLPDGEDQNNGTNTTSSYFANSTPPNLPCADSTSISVELHALYNDCLRYGIILYSRETRRIFHSMVSRRARGSTTFSFYSKSAISLSKRPFIAQHTVLLDLPRYSSKFIKLSNTFLQLLSRFCAPINLSIAGLLDAFSSSRILLRQYNELFAELELRYRELGYNFVSVKRQIYEVIKRESSETQSLLKEFSAFPRTVDFLLDPLILPMLRRRTLKSPHIYVEKYISQRIHLEPPHVYHNLDVISDDDDDESKPALQLKDEHANVAIVKEAQKSIVKSILEQSTGSAHADFYYDLPLDSDQYSDTLRYAFLYSKLFALFITDVVPLISALFFRDFNLNKIQESNRRLEENPVLAYEIFNYQVVLFLQRTFSEDLDMIQENLLELCRAEYAYATEESMNQLRSTSSIEAAITTQNVSTIKLPHKPLVKLDFVCFRKPDVFKPYQRREDLNGLANLVVGFTVDCVAQVTMIRTVVTNLVHSLHRLNTDLEYHLTTNLIFLSKSIVKGYSELPPLKRYCKQLVHKELELIQQDLTSFNIIKPKTFQDRLQREVYLEDIIASRYSDFELAYFEERKRLRLSYAQLLEENFNNITSLKEILYRCPPSSMGSKSNLLIISYNRQFFRQFDQLLSNIYSAAFLCSENITRELERNKLHTIALHNVLRHRYLTASEDAEQLKRLLDDASTQETDNSLPESIFTPPLFLYQSPAKLVVEEQADMTNILHDEILTFNNPLFSVQLTTGEYLNSYGLCDPTKESSSSAATPIPGTVEEQDSEQEQHSDRSETASLATTTQQQSSSKEPHISDCPFPRLGKPSSEKNSIRKRHREASLLYVIVDNATIVINRILNYIRKEILPINPRFYINFIMYDTTLMKKQLINKLIAVIEHVREHVRQTISEVLQTPFATISFFENRICLDMDTPDNLDMVITGLDDAQKFICGWIPAIKMLIDLLPLLSYIESTASITDVQSLFEYLGVSAKLKAGVQTESQGTIHQSDDSDSEGSADKKEDITVHTDGAREDSPAEVERTNQHAAADMDSLHDLSVHRYLLQKDLLFIPEDRITFEQMLDHAFDIQLWTRISKDRSKYERRKTRYLKRVASNKIDPAKLPFEKAVKCQATLPKVSILVSMRLSQLQLRGYAHNYLILSFIEKILNFRRLINTCKRNIDRRLQSFSNFIYLSVEYLLYLRQLCIGLANEVTRLTTSDLISSVARPHEFKEKYPRLTSNIVLNRLEQYFKSQNGEDAYAFIKFVQSHTNLAITRHSSFQRHMITLYTRPTDDYLCSNPLITDLESLFRFLVKCIYELDEDSRSGTIKMSHASGNTLIMKQSADQKQTGNTSPYYDLYAIFTEVHVLVKETVKIFGAITQWSEILGITLAIEEPSFRDILSVVESPCQLLVSIVDMFASYTRIMHQPVTAFNPSLFLTYIDTIFLCSRKMHVAERSNISMLAHAAPSLNDRHDQYNSEYSYHQSTAHRLIEPSTAEFLINEDYDPRHQVILETSIFTTDGIDADAPKGLTTNIDTPRHEELLSKGMDDLTVLISEKNTQSNTFVTRGMKFILSLLDGEKISAGYTLKQQSTLQISQRSKEKPKTSSLPSILTARAAKQELSVVQEENLEGAGSMIDSSVAPTAAKVRDSIYKESTSPPSPSQSSQIITFDDRLLKHAQNLHEDHDQAACDTTSEISTAQLGLPLPAGEVSANSFSIDTARSVRSAKCQFNQHVSVGDTPPNVSSIHGAPAKTVITSVVSAIAAGSRLAISNASRASQFILDNSIRDAPVLTLLSNTGLQSLRDVAMHMNVIKLPVKIKYFQTLYVKQKDVRTVIKLKDNSPDIISAKILETINSFKNTALFECCRLECNYRTWIPTLRLLVVSLLLYGIQHFSFLSTIRLLFNSNHFASYFLNQCLEHACTFDEPTTLSQDWKGFSDHSSISIRDSLELISPFNHQLASQINKQYLLNYSAENRLLEIYYWLHNIDIFITYYTINLHLNDEIARVLGDLDFTFGEHNADAAEAIKTEISDSNSLVPVVQKSGILLPRRTVGVTEVIEDATAPGSETKSDLAEAFKDQHRHCTDSSDEDAFDLFETPFGRIAGCTNRKTTLPLLKPRIKALTIIAPQPSIASRDDDASLSHQPGNSTLSSQTPIKETNDTTKQARAKSILISRDQRHVQSKVLLGNQRTRAPLIRKRRSYDGPARITLPFFNTHPYLLKALREGIFIVTAILADKGVIPKVAKMARIIEDKLIFCRNFVIAIGNVRKLLPELIALTNAIYDGIADLTLLKLSPNDVKKVTIEILSCLKHICIFAKSKHEVVWKLNSMGQQNVHEHESVYTLPFISFLDNLNLLDRRRCGTRLSVPKFYTDESPNPNCFQFMNLFARDILAKVQSFMTNVLAAEELLSRCRRNLSSHPVVTTIYANQQYRICAPYARLPLSFAVLYSQLTTVPLTGVLTDALFNSVFSPLIVDTDESSVEDGFEDEPPRDMTDVKHGPQLSYSLLSNLIDSTGNFFGIFKGHENIFYQTIIKANARVKDCYLFTEGSLHSQHIVHNYRKAALLFLNERYREALLFCTYQAIVYALSCIVYLYCDGRSESFIYCYENVICSMIRILEEETYDLIRGTGKLRAQGSFQVGSTFSATSSRILMLKALYARLLEHKETLDIMALTVVQHVIARNILPPERIPSLTDQFDARLCWDILLLYGRNRGLVLSGLEHGVSLSIATNRQTSALVYSLASDTLLGNGANRRVDLPMLDLTYTAEEKTLIKNAKARLQARTESVSLLTSNSDAPEGTEPRDTKGNDNVAFDDFAALTMELFRTPESLSKLNQATVSTANLDDKMAYATPVSSIALNCDTNITDFRMPTAPLSETLVNIVLSGQLISISSSYFNPANEYDSMYISHTMRLKAARLISALRSKSVALLLTDWARGYFALEVYYLAHLVARYLSSHVLFIPITDASFLPQYNRLRELLISRYLVILYGVDTLTKEHLEMLSTTFATTTLSYGFEDFSSYSISSETRLEFNPYSRSSRSYSSQGWIPIDSDIDHSFCRLIIWLAGAMPQECSVTTTMTSSPSSHSQRSSSGPHIVDEHYIYQVHPHAERVTQKFRKAYMMYLPFIPYISTLQSTHEFRTTQLVCASASLVDQTTFTKNFSAYKSIVLEVYMEHVESLKHQIVVRADKNLGDSCCTISPFQRLFRSLPGLYQDSFYHLHVFLSNLSNDFPKLLGLDFMLIQHRLAPDANRTAACTQTFVYLVSCMYLATEESFCLVDDINSDLLQSDGATHEEVKSEAPHAAINLQHKLSILISCLISVFGLSPANATTFEHSGSRVTSDSMAYMIRRSSSPKYLESLHGLQRSAGILSEFGAYMATVMMDLLAAKEPFAILTTSMAQQFFEYVHAILSRASALTFLLAYSSADIHFYADLLSAFPNRYALAIVLDQHSDLLLYQNILGMLAARQTIYSENNKTYTFKAPVHVIIVARARDARILQLSIRKFSLSRNLHLSDIGFYFMSFGNLSQLNISHLISIQAPTLASISSYDKLMQYIYANFDADYHIYTSSFLTRTKLGLYISYFNFLVFNFVMFISTEIGAHLTLTLRHWRIIKALIHLFFRYYGILDVQTGNDSHRPTLSTEEELSTDTMNLYHELSIRSYTDAKNPISFKQQKDLREASTKPLEFNINDALGSHFSYFSEPISLAHSFADLRGESLQSNPGAHNLNHRSVSFETAYSTMLNQTSAQFTQSFISRLLLTSNSRHIADILHYSVISTVFSAFMLLYRMEYINGGLLFNSLSYYRLYASLLSYIPTFSLTLESEFFEQHVFYRKDGFRLSKWMHLFCDNAIMSLQDLYVSQTYFFTNAETYPTFSALFAKRHAESLNPKVAHSTGSSTGSSTLSRGPNYCETYANVSDMGAAARGEASVEAFSVPDDQFAAKPEKTVSDSNFKSMWGGSTYSFIAITSYLSDRLLLTIAKKLGLTAEIIYELEQVSLPQYRKKCMESLSKRADQLRISRLKETQSTIPTGMSASSVNKIKNNSQAQRLDISRPVNNTSLLPEKAELNADCTDFSAVLRKVASSTSTGQSLQRVSTRVLTSLECQSLPTKGSRISSAPHQLEGDNLASAGTPKTTSRARLGRLKHLQLDSVPEKTGSQDDKYVVSFIRRYMPILEVPYRVGEEIFVSTSLLTMQNSYADTSNSLQLVITNDMSAYAVYYAGCMLSGESFVILGDSFSGKTTILQIAASLIGSDRVSLQTFYVGNSTIKTIADLQVQILRKSYLLRPEISRAGNLYTAQSVNGKFNILHISGLTHANLLEFLSLPLLEHVIYVDISQRDVSKAIGGFCGRIFLRDSVVIYEVSSSCTERTARRLMDMSVYVSTFSATSKPTFFHSLVYRNFVYDHLIQDAYCSMEKSVANYHAIHYDVDDPLTALLPVSPRFHYPKVFQPITARVFAARGIKRFPKLSAESIAGNIDALQSDHRPQLTKYAPMSIVIRTLVKSFAEGLLLIRPLLPISLLELLCSMKQNVYFDDTDVRNVFGYPPSSFLENLHMLVPSANSLFSALLRHGSVPISVSTRVYSELVSAFSVGTLSSTSVFSVLTPEYAEAFKRMYPFLIPFSYSDNGRADTISIMLHFSWETCLKTVIDPDGPSHSALSMPVSSRDSKVSTPNSRHAPVLIFNGDYFTRHRFELQRRIPVSARKDFRYNKILNIDKAYSVDVLKFTGDLIDELSVDDGPKHEPLLPTAVSAAEKPRERAESKKNAALTMLSKMSKFQDIHLTSMLTRAGLDFFDSDSSSDDSSSMTLESTDRSEHRPDLLERRGELTSAANTAIRATYSDYAQGFLRNDNVSTARDRSEQEQEQSHDLDLTQHQLVQDFEDKRPSTTIVRLLVKYRDIREVTHLSSHVAIILIRAYLITEIMWHRNCIKIYEYLSTLRFGPANGMTQFNQFSRVYNPPKILISYLQLSNLHNYVEDTHHMLQFIALLGNFKLVNSLDFMGFITGLYYSPHDGTVRIPKDGQRGSMAPTSTKSKPKQPKDCSVSLLNIHQGMYTNFAIHLLFTRYHRYLINSYQLITLVGILAIEAEIGDVELSIRKSLKPIKSSYYSDSSDEDDFIAQTNPRILRTLKKKSVFTPDSRPFLRAEKPVMTYSGKLSKSDPYYYIFREVNKYCVEREPVNGFSLPLTGLRLDFLVDLVGVYKTSKDVSVLTYYIVRAYLLMALGFSPSLGLKDLSLLRINEFYNTETSSGMGVWNSIDSSLVKKHLGRASIRDFFLPEPVDILLVLHSNLLVGKLDILSSIASLPHTLTAVFLEEELRFISLLVSCYYELDFLLCDQELMWLLSRNFSILVLNDTVSISLDILKCLTILPSIGDQAIQKYVVNGTCLSGTDSFTSVSFTTNYFHNLEKSLNIMFSSVAEPLLRCFSVTSKKTLYLPESNSVLPPDIFGEFRGTLILACTIGYAICLQYLQTSTLNYTLTFSAYTEHVWRFCYLRMGMYSGFAITLYTLANNLRSEALKSKFQRVCLGATATDEAHMQSRPGMQGPSKTNILAAVPEGTCNTNSLLPLMLESKQHAKAPLISPEAADDSITPRGILGRFSSKLTSISHRSRSSTKFNDIVLATQSEDILTIINEIMDDFAAIVRRVIVDSVIAVSSLVFKHQLLPTLQHSNALEVLIMNAAIDADLVKSITTSEYSTQANRYLAHIEGGAVEYKGFQNKGQKPAEVSNRSFMNHFVTEMDSAGIERSLMLALDTFQINLPLLLRYADLALEMRFGMSQDLLNGRISIEYSRYLLFRKSTVHSFLCHTLFSRGQEKIPVLPCSLFLPVLYMAETLRHIEETKNLQHPASADQIKRAYSFEFIDCSMQHDEFISRLRLALSCSGAADHPLCLYNMFAPSCTDNNRSLARLLRSLLTLVNSPLPQPDEFGDTKPFHASLSIDDAVQATLAYHPRMRRMYLSLADPYESLYLLEFNHRLHILHSPVATLQYYVGSETSTSEGTPQSNFPAIGLSAIEKLQRHRQTVLYDYIIEELTIIFTYEAIHLNLPIIRISQFLLRKNKIVGVLSEFNRYLEGLSAPQNPVTLTDVELFLAYIKHIHAELQKLTDFTIIPLSIKQGIRTRARTLLSVYELLWKLSERFEALSVAFTDTFFFSLVTSVIVDLQGVDHSALHHRRLLPKHTSERRMTELLPTIVHHLLSKISAIVPQAYMKSLLGMISCLESISGQCNVQKHMLLFSSIVTDQSLSKPVGFLDNGRAMDSFLPNTADSLAIERWNKLCSLVFIAPDLAKEWVAFFSTQKTQYLTYVRGSSFFRKVLGHYAYVERSSKHSNRLSAETFLAPHALLKSAVHEYNIVELFGGFTSETGIVPAWSSTSNKAVYGSGTVPVKEPIANTHPGDYNSYKVTDKKTINSDDDTSSEGSVASLTDEDYDAMFDYDYADSENMHPSLQAKTATKARKHISMSRRSMTAMLKRAETAGFSVKTTHQDKGKSANFENSMQLHNNTDSVYERLIPDELIMELKDDMTLGNFPISIQSPSANGVWIAFLLSICLNPTHLQEDLNLLMKVSKLTNSASFSLVDVFSSDRDDELLSKFLQCPLKSLTGSISKFIAAFYRSQLWSQDFPPSEKLSYGMFFSDNGQPLSHASKQSLLEEMCPMCASKTVAIFFDSTLDILTLISFAFEYLVDQLLLTAPVVYKTKPTHADLLSYLVVVLSDGNKSVEWLVQLFISKPVRPKHGLIILIPTSYSAPALSRVLIGHLCAAFAPELVVFNAPIGKIEKIHHYFTLFRIQQIHFATRHSTDKALALEAGTLKLPIISSRTLLGLLIFFVTQSPPPDCPHIRISDTYTTLDSAAALLFQAVIESEHMQALVNTLRTRLRVHPAIIEKIQNLYAAIWATISAIRRYDPERASYHPLNRRLTELYNQLLVSYARVFHKLDHVSVYEKIYTSPGSLLHSRFLKHCIFSLCHELQDKVTLAHNLIVEMPQGATVSDEAISELAVSSDSDLSDSSNCTANALTSLHTEGTQGLSDTDTLKSDPQHSTELTRIYSVDDVARTSQQSEVDMSKDVLLGSHRLGSGLGLSISLEKKFIRKENLCDTERNRYKQSDDDLQVVGNPREFRVYGPSARLLNLHHALVLETSRSQQSKREESGEQAITALNSYLEEVQKLSQQAVQLPCVFTEERVADPTAFKELCKQYLYSLTLYSDEGRLSPSQIVSLIQKDDTRDVIPLSKPQNLITIKEIRSFPGLRSMAFTESADILDRVSVQAMHTPLSIGLQTTSVHSAEGYVINSLLANAVMLAKPIIDLSMAVMDHAGVLICEANRCWRFLDFILTAKRHQLARGNVPYANLCSVLLPEPPQPNTRYVVYKGMLYTGGVLRHVSEATDAMADASRLGYVHITNIELHNVGYDTHNQSVVDCSMDPWPIVYKMSVYAATVIRINSWDPQLLPFRQASPKYVAIRANFAADTYLYLENKSTLSRAELAQRNLHLSPASQK